jgi:hypothetical protein
MSKVFVLDTMERQLDPVHPGWARKLLSSGQAAVFRQYPFTIILKQEVVAPSVQPLRLKIDPGSKTTGLAIVNDASGEVVWAAELMHRGQTIKAALDDRRAIRRSRRQRHTRYRKPRFQNRCSNKKGWLPPSLESRLSNVMTWAARLMRVSPVSAVSQELVRFDLQAVENAEIKGVQYQQGTLAGYEVREYLLEKWNRACTYCVTPVKRASSQQGAIPYFLWERKYAQRLTCPRKVGKDHSMTRRQGDQWFQQTGESLRAISTW